LAPCLVASRPALHLTIGHVQLQALGHNARLMLPLSRTTLCRKR
jgi:hypothetical protein